MKPTMARPTARMLSRIPMTPVMMPVSQKPLASGLRLRPRMPVTIAAMPSGAERNQKRIVTTDTMPRTMDVMLRPLEAGAPPWPGW
ncbi:hypothetical protein [Clavibacter zhangzhiyongii]|uniref:hypothetical protein n=1 Tax=Clavibacter zhangzhiyongii TaxID=2768071 RepID=UPI0039E0DBA6